MRLPILLTHLLAMSPFLLAATAARADVPRDPGWVPSCTVEKAQQAGGGPCEECRMYPAEACQEGLAKKGYTKRCTEGGAGSYVAVWCKGPPASPAEGQGTVKPSSSRCAMSAAPGEGGGWALGLGALGLLLAGARRRR